jgi:GT2 family glycosyltransferase
MKNSFKPEMEKVTVVIPNWNGMQWLGGCLESLHKQDLLDFKIVVVDNGSTDSSIQFIKSHYPEVELIELTRNVGFAKAVNMGIEKSTTPYIAILNNDTSVYREWLSTLLDKIESLPPDIAGVSPKMLRMDDRGVVDDAGDELSWYGSATKRGRGEPASAYCDEVEVFSPSGGASLYRREFLVKTGGFDPDFFAYLEDVDLGLRGRLLGYRYLYLPTAKVLHKSHGSGIKFADYVELVTRNRLLLFAKNVPSSLLFKHSLKLLYGQLYFFIIYGHPLASLKGYWSFIINLPETKKKRRKQMKKIKIDQAEISSIIHSRAPRPSLSSSITSYVIRIFSKLE